MSEIHKNKCDAAGNSEKAVRPGFSVYLLIFILF